MGKTAVFWIDLNNIKNLIHSTFNQHFLCISHCIKVLDMQSQSFFFKVISAFKEGLSNLAAAAAAVKDKRQICRLLLSSSVST